MLVPGCPKLPVNFFFHVVLSRWSSLDRFNALNVALGDSALIERWSRYELHGSRASRGVRAPVRPVVIELSPSRLGPHIEWTRQLQAPVDTHMHTRTDGMQTPQASAPSHTQRVQEDSL